MARDDSTLPITVSFEKVVNKLSARDWPLLWECMRVEFALQAECLRRDVVRHMFLEGRKGGKEQKRSCVKGYRVFLQGLLGCFDVFSAWVFEVASFFSKLNDQISGERFRATTSSFAGCGVREVNNTPYVSESALIGFRDHVMMHFGVRRVLLGAIEGDGSLDLAGCFGVGGGDATSMGVMKSAGAAAAGLGVEPEEDEVDDEILASRLKAYTGEEGAGGIGRRSSTSSSVSSASERGRITENLSEELVKLGKMADELDVVEAGNERCENYRRMILKPLRMTLAEIRVDGVVEGGGGAGAAGAGCDGKGEEEMLMLNEERMGGCGRRFSRGREGMKRRRLL
jgi:hypothetical protein